MNNKTNLLLGFQSSSSGIKNGDSSKTENGTSADFLIGLIELLDSFQNIKTTFHLSSNLISYLDKKNSGFSSNLRLLLERNQVELLSGGLYEPLIPLTPKEDRQTQFSLMNRFLNHTFGYTPSGALLAEYSWEPSVALDLAKSRLQYTCLPKEHFTQAGLDEKNIQGYYLTEEEGRKIAIFPISCELNQFISKYNPEEALRNLEEKNIDNASHSIVLFCDCNDRDLKTLSWLKIFFHLLTNKNDSFETRLFHEYYIHTKPSGRIYIPEAGNTTEQSYKPWKNSLLRYPEANLLQKKMLRVSKKINSAKEGKSRFKVIKEMISQAQDLLFQGQRNNAYWDNILSGLYIPEERHRTYSCLIKAENLIDAASRQAPKWIQVYEIDYDCDGHDEIIIETESQNIYISPSMGGTILEHDYRSKNINLTNVISRKEESYHRNSDNILYKDLIYDNIPKLNLIDHFFENDLTLDKLKRNKCKHLTNEILIPYHVEKIKAKEENCKITLNHSLKLVKLEGLPEIDIKKQIIVRAGNTSILFDYILNNKFLIPIDFTFAIEFNLNITPQTNQESYMYTEGNKNNKTLTSGLHLEEELKEINQISIYNKPYGIDMSFSWNKTCNLFRYPVETISYKNKVLESIYQGTTILPTWHIILEPGKNWELSISENVLTESEEL